MFDAKKLLDQFLGSQMPGASGSVGQKGNDLLGMAKANPWKSGALAAVLLGGCWLYTPDKPRAALEARVFF